MYGVMEVIVPFAGKQRSISVLVARMQEGDVSTIFGSEVNGAIGNSGADALGNLNQHMLFAGIVNLIDGIKAQAIQIKFLQPVERRFHDIAAHRINVIGDTGAPRRLALFVEEVRREQRQIVALRAEVVQHDIQHHRQAETVRRIDKGFEIIRRTVGGMRCIEQYAIVAPATIAAKLRHRQHFNHGDAGFGQHRQLLYRRPEGAFLGKGADVQFIDH